MSAASYWEVAIKSAMGKLDLGPNLSPTTFFEHAANALQYETLAITPRDGLSAGQLVAHHKDPFDRMLISQASTHGLTLVSSDKVFEEYDVRTLW